MPRVARLVVPGLIHHVTERGNNQERVFVTDADRLEYLDRLRFFCPQAEVQVYGFCLMTNHVHLLLRPANDDSLARLIRRAHSEYSAYFNQQYGRCGHLWHNRFFSCPLEGGHVLNALRYVDRNPVRAGIAHHPADWPWSSAKAHSENTQDEFRLLCLDWRTWREWPADWRQFLTSEDAPADRLIRTATKSSRPLGSAHFIQNLEQRSGRYLSPRATGRPTD